MTTYYAKAETVNHFVLRKQHLASVSECADTVRIARDLCGLHATAAMTPFLSLFARSKLFQKAHLDKELYVERTLARIKCVRNTIYIHPKDSIPFLHAATVDMVTRDSRRFMDSQGVTNAQFTKTRSAITECLKKREMTASDLKTAIGAKREISSILYHLCDQGVLIRGRPEGGWRSKKQTYALFSDYFPDIDLKAVGKSEAIEWLIIHYIAAFGPVAEADIVWWTGLGKQVIRGALQRLAGQVVRIGVIGSADELYLLRTDQESLRDCSPPQEPIISLLPVQDPYLMGYKQRDRYLDERHREYIFDRAGNATSSIIVDGRVVGVWDSEETKVPAIRVFLLNQVTKEIQRRIFDYAPEVGEFIFDTPPEVKPCNSMVPLTRRTAGSVMSPLRLGSTSGA